MSARALPQFGPITRISVGLIAMLISLVLVADIALGVVPGRTQVEHQVRQRVAENLAFQLTSLLQAGDEVTIGKTLQQVLHRDPEIRSISVRRKDGQTVIRRGDADNLNPMAGTERSTLNRLRVPILAAQGPWGEVEVRFADNEPTTLRAWLSQPAAQLLAVLAFGGFGLCYLYLRRVMQYLDPSATVPDRVRNAFDTLTEGVVILDRSSRIVLANKSFRSLHPDPEAELNGRPIGSLDWLAPDDEGGGDAQAPWARTLGSAVTVDAVPFSVLRPDGAPNRLLVTSSPITDGKGQARGCMVTFNDITPVHRANEELRSALSELEQSRGRVETQNQELRTLASRDPMTGCLNRRAFFDAAEHAFEAATRGHGEVCCIMADIDHFKQFNDLHGHAVGDQVIVAVARLLLAGSRPQDIVCRYGGEEFCIVLPGASVDDATEIAERLRRSIEEHAQSAVRGASVLPVTASFGVSTRALGVRSLPELIDHADQALYRAKQTGRRRVTVYQRA
jgi:diguanylate cyclase (GGDEF)-like protein/PAS domain S-box-containing protein